MNRKRLTMMVDMLEQIAAIPEWMEMPKFDMGGWMEAENDGPVPELGEPLTCNTSACAIGHACCNPAFQALGLSYYRVNDGTGIKPTYKNYEGFDAAARFFGITEYEAQKLFGPKEYTAKQEATRIRRFMASHR